MRKEPSLLLATLTIRLANDSITTSLIYKSDI